MACLVLAGCCSSSITAVQFGGKCAQEPPPGVSFCSPRSSSLLLLTHETLPHGEHTRERERGESLCRKDVRTFRFSYFRESIPDPCCFVPHSAGDCRADRPRRLLVNPTLNMHQHVSSLFPTHSRYGRCSASATDSSSTNTTRPRQLLWTVLHATLKPALELPPW